MKHYLLTSVALAISALVACGGGGSDVESTAADQQSLQGAGSFKLSKDSYSGGERIPLKTLVPDAQSAELVFSDGTKVDVPLLGDGMIVIPVIPPERATTPVRLAVATPSRRFNSDAFTLKLIAVPTSIAGIATLVYIDIAIANLNAAADELIPINPAQVEIAKQRKLMVDLRTSIVAAQQGMPVVLLTTNGGIDVVLDAKQLEAFDQHILAVVAVTRIEVKNQTLKRPALEPARAKAVVLPNCDGYAEVDKGYCANLTAQIVATDMIGTAAGQVGLVTGGVGAVLGVAAALGFTAAAIPAAAVVTATIATVVTANVIGLGVQAISAARTGTTDGLDFRDNVTNITGELRNLVIGGLAKWIPNTAANINPDLLTMLYEAVIGLDVKELLASIPASSTPTPPPTTPPPPSPFLRVMPPAGSIPFGQIVYVDDGGCPSGQLKQVIGGDNSRGIPRQITCVPIPVLIGVRFQFVGPKSTIFS